VRRGQRLNGRDIGPYGEQTDDDRTAPPPTVRSTKQEQGQQGDRGHLDQNDQSFPGAGYAGEREAGDGKTETPIRKPLPRRGYKSNDSSNADQPESGDGSFFPIEHNSMLEIFDSQLFEIGRDIPFFYAVDTPGH
jgi:hypothetical protein